MGLLKYQEGSPGAWVWKLVQEKAGPARPLETLWGENPG